jgi:hypothetical protein
MTRCRPDSACGSAQDHVDIWGAAGLRVARGRALSGMNGSIRGSWRERQPAQLACIITIIGACATGPTGCNQQDESRQARIDGLLFGDDPCGVKSIDQTDREWMAQHDAVVRAQVKESRSNVHSIRLKQCESRRKKQTIDATCQLASVAIANGKVPDKLDHLTPEDVGQLGRIAAKSLTPADVEQYPAIACRMTSAENEVDRSFARAAGASAKSLFAAKALGDDLATKISGAGLTAAAVEAIRSEAELLVAPAPDKPGENASTGKLRICDRAKALGVEDGPRCGRLRQAEATRVKRCEALVRAHQTCVNRCEARGPRDELGFGDLDRALDCGETCDRQVPRNNCE